MTDIAFRRDGTMVIFHHPYLSEEYKNLASQFEECRNRVTEKLEEEKRNEKESSDS